MSLVSQPRFDVVVLTQPREAGSSQIRGNVRDRCTRIDDRDGYIGAASRQNEQNIPPNKKIDPVRVEELFCNHCEASWWAETPNQARASRSTASEVGIQD